MSQATSLTVEQETVMAMLRQDKAYVVVWDHRAYGIICTWDVKLGVWSCKVPVDAYMVWDLEAMGYVEKQIVKPTACSYVAIVPKQLGKGGR